MEPYTLDDCIPTHDYATGSRCQTLLARGKSMVSMNKRFSDVRTAMNQQRMESTTTELRHNGEWL